MGNGAQLGMDELFNSQKLQTSNRFLLTVFKAAA